MGAFQADNFILISISVFFAGSLSALILIGKDRLCNLIANGAAIIGSLFLAVASLYKILMPGEEAGTISLFKSTLPFIVMDMKVDGLSSAFLLALSVLTICVSIYSIGYISQYYGKRNVGIFYFLYMMFILSMVFVFTSSNAVFFYIAWEAMALLSYFLVIFESEKSENRQAGLLYIIMTHIGTAFLLIGIMVSYSYTKTFDLFASSEGIPIAAKNIIFLLYLLGFGTKAGAIPLHIWLPRAHPSAPSNISALMSGIMIKTAIYGLIRFVPGFLGVEKVWWGGLIFSIGMISAVLGVAYAMVETDIKRLLAYSSVENMGIILMGLGVALVALAQGNQLIGSLALMASIFHAMNHALFKGGLFLGAGAIHYGTGTKNIEKLGGLIKIMPVTAILVLCFALSISAIVPFNGFIGEWLTLQSIFACILQGMQGINIILILGAAGLGMAGAMAAACFVNMFGISFLGLPRSEKATVTKKIPVTMNISMGILASLCLTIGLFPITIISMLDRVVSQVTGTSILHQMQGGFLISWYSMDFKGNEISSSVMLVVISIIIVLSLIALRIFGGRYKERRYGTWDCGFQALNARMQYTATGFSKPLKIILRILFRPSRQTSIKEGTIYHPKVIEYKMDSESIFEKYLYLPVVVKAKLLSRRTKFIVQTGKIHNYLLYIFITLLALMSYNRFF
ncbi:MAG: proton-conducting transporter membrane subunit [Anaerovoracaceae bacterium]